VNGEPKGSHLSLDRHKSLAAMLNVHRGVMTVPVTVNREMGSPPFDLWPLKLKAILEKQAGKCIQESMQRHVETLAKQCGNLRAVQIARLFVYKIAVERALHGICLFYHCGKYHSAYAPIKIIFDRTGTANNREELVFKEMIFFWVSDQVFNTITQIHTDDHPFVRLYGAEVGGRRAFDVAKMVGGKFEFLDSKRTWQLQLTDMLASAWINALRDHRNDRGYLSIFRILQKNTTLHVDQPVGMISLAEYREETHAPAIYNVYRRLVAKEGKVLPCGWDEE
jgi:hypothetical protein